METREIMRMEKVREALHFARSNGMEWHDYQATLAEVEEWETRLHHTQNAKEIAKRMVVTERNRAEAAEADLNETRSLLLKATDDRRLKAAEADRDLLQRALNSMDSHAVRLMGEALAEADRLKAALEQTRPLVARAAGGYDSHRGPEWPNALFTIDAALAPADRNTT